MCEAKIDIQMRVYAFISSFVLIASILITVPSYAEDDVFVVPRVMVNAQADSAIAAKRLAELQGRRQAMDILLRRLAMEEDWGYLPNLADNKIANFSVDYGTKNESTINDGGGNDGFSSQRPTSPFEARPSFGKRAIFLDDDLLRELEQSFEVYDEKSSPTTYRAFITYRFKPAETRELLIAAQIPYSEAQTRIALVLPVLETDNGLYLWESNNPWLTAWKGRPLTYELTPMVAPLGDLSDSSTISAREVLAFNQEKLAIIAERYGVSQVIVAHGRLKQSDGLDKLRVSLINGYRESGALNADANAFSTNDALDRVVDATGNRIDRDPFAGSATDASRPSLNGQGLSNQGFSGRETTNNSEPGTVLAETWLNEASGNFPNLANQAILSSITKYSSAWKAQTLIDHSVSVVLNATAFFHSLNEWKQIRSALISTPLVGSVQVQNLSRRGAEMSIRSFGDPGKLVVALESQGLSFWSYDEGPIEDVVWNIATPTTASTIPEAVQRAPLRDQGFFQRSAPVRSNSGFPQNRGSFR